MTDDERIIKKALDFARRNKKRIAGELTNKKIFIPDSKPVSIFMAGSPGAGKTEFSKRVLEILEKDGRRVVRIDPDDLRDYFKEYTGSNSDLFQPSVSVLVEKIHDLVLKNKQNFIFDSTFSDLTKAKENIKRSLRKDRLVEIMFVYQKPSLAWEFTQKREQNEGRSVPRQAFIDRFLGAQNVVNSVKKDFGSDIRLNILIKDLDQSDLTYRGNIQEIEHFLPRIYSKEELEDLLD